MPIKLLLSVILLLLTFFSRGAIGQRPPADEAKYARFTHKSHSGTVSNPFNKAQVTNLDCGYCHGAPVRDRLGEGQHDLEAIGYPSHLRAAGGARAHTACTSCHAFAGPRMERQMCTICHQELTPDPRNMATNLRRLPNPQGPIKSNFFDYFSHRDHVDFYDQFVMATSLRTRFKFFDQKAASGNAKGLDRNRFECATCHQSNNIEAAIAGITFKPGVKMGAPGHPECFVCHFDPTVVAPPRKDKPSPNNSFATNCSGCHQTTARPEVNGRPTRGSELMTLWFDRRIVNTERNQSRPNGKSPLPFSHQTHSDAVGKSVADCLSCHATGKTAQTSADFHLPDRKTGEKQPLPFSCIECHKKEMQTKIAGETTLEGAKCNYCHSLTTIRDLAAKGASMPPDSHFRQKSAPAAKPSSN